MSESTASLSLAANVVEHRLRVLSQKILAPELLRGGRSDHVDTVTQIDDTRPGLVFRLARL